MKICVTSTGCELSSDIDARFGRCSYFIIADPDTMEFEALENTPGGGGAGVRSGEIMDSKNVEAVITGNLGPNAYAALEAGGIVMYTGCTGTVIDAIRKFKNGELSATDAPTTASHTGLGGASHRRGRVRRNSG
jgi:predicted Fe-Mo cluster-binding NifX family protein